MDVAQDWTECADGLSGLALSQEQSDCEVVARASELKLSRKTYFCSQTRDGVLE